MGCEKLRKVQQSTKVKRDAVAVPQRARGPRSPAPRLAVQLRKGPRDLAPWERCSPALAPQVPGDEVLQFSQLSPRSPWDSSSGRGPELTEETDGRCTGRGCRALGRAQRKLEGRFQSPEPPGSRPSWAQAGPSGQRIGGNTQVLRLGYTWGWRVYEGHPGAKSVSSYTPRVLPGEQRVATLCLGQSTSAYKWLKWPKAFITAD